MKKLINSIALFFFVIASCLPVYATDVSEQLNLEGDFVKIKNTIALFYENKDMGADNDLNSMTNALTASILSEKSSIQNNVTDIYQTDKTNYNVVVSIENYDLKGNILYTENTISVSFNYILSPDIESGYSELAYVAYDIETDLVSDLLVPSNYYDSFIRSQGENQPINELTFQDFSNGYAINNKIKEVELEDKVDQLRDLITQEYQNTSIEQSSVSQMQGDTRLSTLNSTNIVNYARRNFNQQYPESGSSSISYTDFYDGSSGSYDCTNFVSHALLAGGANMKSSSSSGIQGNSFWYFRNSKNRSSSWTSVNGLHSYISNNSTSNTLAGLSMVYSTRNIPWATGNVIQFADTSGEWWHSCIITGKAISGESTFALCTGRTGYGRNNNNQRAEDIYPGGAKRTIGIYNY